MSSHDQEKVFEQAYTYINKYVHDTIKENIVNNKASYDLDPMQISWTVKVSKEKYNKARTYKEVSGN